MGLGAALATGPPFFVAMRLSERNAYAVIGALRWAVRAELRNCFFSNLTRDEERIEADNAWWLLLNLLIRRPREEEGSAD